MGKYFLGLDIGTDSVGFAVTDEAYNIVKKGKKELIGTRLFESGNTALERRGFRALRRRLQRTKDRTFFLRELFAEEISKIDPSFFMRLDESTFHLEDKTESTKSTLFDDLLFKDADYHNKYKTIYHLRKALVNGEENDIRLLYLGIAHIIKHRGHFLFEGQEFGNIADFNIAYNSLKELFLEDEFSKFDFNISNVSEFESILKDKNLGIKAKEDKIHKLLDGKPDANQKNIIKLILGGKISKLSSLFGEEIDEEIAGKSICFKGDYEKFYEENASKLDESIKLIEMAKAIYDWSVLIDILDCPKKDGEITLSDAKIHKYNTHHNDLILLKEMVKKYIPNSYKEIFSASNISCNYASYIGNTKKNNKKQVLENKICTNEDFCKYILPKFKGIEVEEKYQTLLKKAEEQTLLPKLRTKDNSVIPYQVHRKELEFILKNNEDKFGFLKQSDGKHTISQKIDMIFMYKIPYYVGPLNTHSDYSWVSRVSEKITPWNFNDVVNLEESAENFINNLTNKCTYLRNCDVLPKKSLLYSKYEVLNELNNLKIDGKSISVELKQDIFENVFKVNKKVTAKKLRDFLVKKSITDKNATFTGIDGDFKSSLETYIDFNEILADNFDEKTVEDIIKWITLFGDDKKILKSKIRSVYDLDEQILNKICAKKYTGWGRLSGELLETLVSKVDEHEDINIIDAMYQTNYNFMELLSNRYEYIHQINDLREEKTDITLDDVKDLYCSPAVKKSIWQSVQIVKEVEKIMGSSPEKLFIEVTRSEDDLKKRTTSRKNQLLKIYKDSFKKEYADLITVLDGLSDSDLRQKKLYLYFMQLGKCAYTGREIDISDLNNQNLYDIEHIYPRSITKDDSIINNLVLVYKPANAKKDNKYPIPKEYRQENLWKLWYEKGLISKTKYERLTRNTEFEAKELEGFVARQLVETSQASKAVAELFTDYLKPKNSKVCYVKAGNVSDFRKHFDMVKVRDINDYHHAHDAYFNIVVGNVWDEKFTKNFFSNIKNENYSLKPEVLYHRDYKKGDKIVWDKDNSIKFVKNTFYNSKVLFTRHSYKATGTLFDQTIYKKGQGEMAVKNPTKDDSRFMPLTDISKYGSYKSLKGTCFCVVEHTLKKKVVRTIEFVPIYLANQIKDDPLFLDKYLKENLELAQHKIILRELKIGALLNVDGFPMHVSGRTGDRIVFKGAVQLKLDAKGNEYFKRIANYMARKKTNPTAKLIAIDLITKDDNLKYYDLFKDKLESSIYSKMLKSQSKTLEEKIENFIGLSVEEQCEVLNNLLIMFKCDPRKANLSLIGAGSAVGTILISKKISEKSSVKLINQSITGFYENSIDLLK